MSKAPFIIAVLAVMAIAGIFGIAVRTGTSLFAAFWFAFLVLAVVGAASGRLEQ